jgi:hypothetical protein
MKKYFILVLCYHFQVSAQTPNAVLTLMKHYPQIKGYEAGRLIFYDNTGIVYDDEKEKNHSQLLENADIEDMFKWKYHKGTSPKSLPKNYDPGRYRNEAFFRKIYGNSAHEVELNLEEIIWCPRLVGQRLRVTKVNGIAEKLKAISTELDAHPEWQHFLKKAGGTFNWRYISGTKRLSQHSYGASIDLNVAYSNYWQWDRKTANEDIDLIYKNRIPQGIVDIFEKYGFIWGGKWYHYDTMHFEYRPELIED